MNVLLTNQPVSVTIPAPSEATSYTWRVIDQNENLVTDGSPTPMAGESEVVISVAAIANTLSENELRSLRSVEVIFTTPAGAVLASDQYIVEAEKTLVVNVNTFQTYGEATLGAYELFGLQGWNIATKQDREMALVAARRNIAELRFRYQFDAYQDVIDSSVGVSDLTLISQSRWDALPADFKQALKRAQILEADFLLTGGENAVDVKRRLGIISETIGESSMFLRAAKPLEQAVCRRAMKELSKYTINRIRIART